jgi:hypothetical protein
LPTSSPKTDAFRQGNLETARLLGPTIPPSVLARAGDLIQ